MHTSLRSVGALGATAIVAAALIALPSPVTASAAADYAGLPSGIQTTKTLVVGIDGASFDVLALSSIPRLNALMDGGTVSTSNLYADPMAPTVSGPGWSTIATGVWPDKHNVVDNGFGAPKYDQYPDYMTRMETADPRTSTLVVGTWDPISTTIFGSAVDKRVAGKTDARTTSVVTDYLKNGNPDSTFVHLDEVDGAGHSFGTDSASYREALARADMQLGEMLDAIAARPTYASEKWMIVVTADHGHTVAGGHGGNSMGERKTFVIANGPGVPAGQVRFDAKLADIAPTVLAFSGIAADTAWDLDGEVLDQIVPDDFDALRGSLQGAVDETDAPAGAVGWTTTAPNGWSIDNSALPAGGVTEWRGWSFTTDEFWTNIALDQGRETSVRNRNVFAVADSDEWDDLSHDPGIFDSTLISPDYPVRGGAAATLSFATNYVWDGPQTGDVQVSYDGGTPETVKSYRYMDVNTVEKIELAVPAGARTVQVRFHYTGDNSAFWTVDQVRVTQDAASTVPSAPQAPAVVAGDGSVRLSWSAPHDGGSSITDYVATAMPGGAECVTTERSCTITGLTNGTEYTFTLVARNLNGASPASAASAAVTPVTGTPTTPGGSDTPGSGTGAPVTGSPVTDAGVSAATTAGTLPRTGAAHGWAIAAGISAGLSLLVGTALLVIRRRNHTATR